MTLNLGLIAEASRVGAVDFPRRVITGLACPYGEPGRTNLGPRALRASAVRFLDPVAPVVLGTYGHGDEHGAERGPVVARMTAYENTDAGLRLSWHVGPGALGDRLLAEADPRTGTRAGMSVELDNVQLDPWTGDIIGADPLEYVAFVPIGAYASARVDLVAARANPTGTGDDVTRRHASRFAREFIQVGGGQPAPQQQQQQPAQQPAPQQQQQQPAQQPAPQQQQPAGLFAQAQPQQWQFPQQPAPQPIYVLPPNGYPYPQAPAQQPAPPVPVPAVVGAGGAAGGLDHTLRARDAQQQQQQQQQQQAAGLRPSAGPAYTPGSIRRLAQLRAAMHRNDQPAVDNLRAALVDITNNGANGTGLDMFQGLPGSYGIELWHGAMYTRRFVPLFTPKELTTWKFGGWRWVTRPKLAAYAGDKADVPSNPVKVEFASGEAERVAGAWDIDRKFRDFGDPEFWQGFYEGQTESYAELSDLAAASALSTYALDMGTVDNRPDPTQQGGTPYADVTYGLGVLPAVAFGDAILQDTPNVRRPADFVMMNTGDWLSLTQITNLDVPAFLALLGVKPENFLRSAVAPAGHIVMGCTPAISFYELGGGSPVRVEALDVAHGGIDTGVFGYYGTLLNRPGGVISVPINVLAGGS